MQEPVIRIAHGAGGQMMNDLIRDTFTPHITTQADG